MRKLYESKQALQDKCEEYFNKTNLVAPRSFRVYIGVSKHMLSTWKKTNPEYFNLIKSYEEKILAFVEEIAIYGAVHPTINSIPTKTTDTMSETKFNQIGAMFILKAYDNELYNKAPAADQIEDKAAPIKIDFNNNSQHKLPVLEAEVKEQ